MPQLPDVAPLQDGAPGLKGYELLNWFGLFATGGTPADVIDKINAVTNKTLAESKTAKTLSDQGIVARETSPAEFKAFVEAESRKFREVIEKAKIKLEN